MDAEQKEVAQSASPDPENGLARVRQRPPRRPAANATSTTTNTPTAASVVDDKSTVSDNDPGARPKSATGPPEPTTPTSRTPRRPSVSSSSPSSPSPPHQGSPYDSRPEQRRRKAPSPTVPATSGTTPSAAPAQNPADPHDEPVEHDRSDAEARSASAPTRRDSPCSAEHTQTEQKPDQHAAEPEVAGCRCGAKNGSTPHRGRC